MEEHILKFCILLRKAGIKVSLTEVQDCLKSIRMTGFAKPVFYQTLRSTIIKDHIHFRTFDRAFNLYFGPLAIEEQPFQTNPLPGFTPALDTGMQPELALEATDACHGNGQGLGRGTGHQHRLVQLIRLGGTDQYKSFITDGLERLGPMTQDHLNDLDGTLLKVKVLLEWNMAVNQLTREAEQEQSELWWVWQSRLEDLHEVLRQSLEEKLVAAFGEDAFIKVLKRENLNELAFYELNSYQVDEMRKKIARIGHRLATRVSFRKARAKKGTIDLARTLRNSVNTGGVPIKPAFRDRIPARPDFFVLCDLSGSVKQFSEFMLQLVYAIQSRYLHVRSFVFVDTIAEASECLQSKEVTDGICDIYNNLKFSKTGFSDYGLVFEELYNRYGQELTKKTTLLIIGDARNNYRPHLTEYLARVQEQVKKIIWLNPEPQELWNREDSIMKIYQPYCHQTFECHNLEQLGWVARQIM